jgi:predicted aspartyl protease
LSTGKTRNIVGWVDDRRRPLINLRVWREDVCALVDTGFNGYLLWEASESDGADFPGELSSLYESIEVAGGQALVMLAWTNIDWLGEEGDYTGVETFVSLTAKRTRAGDPVAYVGTALLTGATLVVDFLAATLRIERNH